MYNKLIKNYTNNIMVTRKKIFLFILLTLIICSFALIGCGKSGSKTENNNSSTVSNTGDGSINNPYIISTVADYKGISGKDDSAITKYFKLANDIDFNNQDVEILTTYNGNLNGNGKTLKNIKITINELSKIKPVGNRYDVGLIGINYGTVHNLKIDTISLTVDEVSDADSKTVIYIGALAGYNNGEITNCQIDKGNIIAQNIGN